MPTYSSDLKKTHKCRFSEDTLRCAILSGSKAALRGCVDHIPSLSFRAGVRKDGLASQNSVCFQELILPLGICQGAQTAPTTNHSHLFYMWDLWSQNVS